MAMRFLDANCMIGTSGLVHAAGLLGTEAILADAERCGIERVVGHHAIAREWDPRRGNDLLRELMEVDQRVLGCWVLEPLDTFASGAADRVVDGLIRDGFVAARLVPDVAAHNYEIGGRGARAFLAACAERDLPVFLETEYPDWSAIDGILTATPTLPLILTGISYRRSRNLYPLLDVHPGLRVETSTFVPHMGIEDVMARFGADRVLFGTKLPTYAAGAAVARILRADLDDVDKQRVAADNLQALIDGVRR